MGALYLLVILAVLVGSSESTIARLQSVALDRTRANLVEDFERARFVVDEFYQTTGALPNTLADALALQPEFPTLDGRIRYSVERNIDGAIFRFDRAAVWVISPEIAVDDATYLANNACGSQDFTLADAWCGPPALASHTLETRDDFAASLQATRSYILDTLQKFVASTYTDARFPSEEPDGTPMASGNAYTLAGLVGYGGTAQACDGMFVFDEIALECADLFPPPYGAPLTYQFDDEAHIALVAQLPVQRTGGANIIIGHAMRL